MDQRTRLATSAANLVTFPVIVPTHPPKARDVEVVVSSLAVAAAVVDPRNATR